MIKQVSFDAPPVRRREMLRYSGCIAETLEISRLADKCCEEIAGRLSYRVCYDIFDLRREGNFLCFADIKTASETLAAAFDGCNGVLVFGATVGAEMDRLIMKYSSIQPSMALMMQALGAERIESLCDAFCEMTAAELSKQGKTLMPRVSPGYGDISLAMQKDIFALLDCPRKIGLTLNDRLIMSPSKSVTAFAGIWCRIENNHTVQNGEKI